MSVRVNLLPDEVRARGQANRARILAGVGALVFILLLAGLSFLQRSSINDAEARLAQVQAANTQLQAEIAALGPFADLESRADTSVELVGVALGTEGSLAAVLQDLAAVLPPNAQLDTVAVTLAEAPESPAPGGDRVAHGSLAATGRVLDGVAPGVERLIIDLERVAAFGNVYVTTSTVDEDGIATFTLEADLGPEVLTGRYELPSEGADS